jgi:hypothetical protein
MPIIIPILMTIAYLVFNINEKTTNNSSPTNQNSNTTNKISYTGKTKAQFVGQMKRCGYCSARVPLDAQACSQCPDKLAMFRWESESDALKPVEPSVDEPKSLEIKLREIDRLRESGVITEVEYQTKRKAIIESH